MVLIGSPNGIQIGPIASRPVIFSFIYRWEMGKSVLAAETQFVTALVFFSSFHIFFLLFGLSANEGNFRGGMTEKKESRYPGRPREL